MDVEESGIDFVSGPQLPAHVYIHVPFCRSKCAYCDFVSVADADDETVRAVVEAIRSDIRRWAESTLPGVVETVYLGGGTPTHVPEHTIKILERATSAFPLRDSAEVTVEANPESLTRELASSLHEAGATRLSLGVQSFDDKVLRLLGRAHDSSTAAEAAAAATRAGLSLSIDLMCGIPGQSMTSWQETLDHALRTGARHVSVYPLTLEAGTPLGVACDAGLVDEPDADIAADMMLLAEVVLTAAGMHRYEVANYALPGFESKHNMAYWTGRSYLGIGPSAHGMLDSITAVAVGLVDEADVPTSESGSREARVRYQETPEIDRWLFGADEEIELMTPAGAIREDVMLGMRLAAGVPAPQVRAAGLDDVFAGLEREGLVKLTRTGDARDGRSERWVTTRRGWLLGNEVFSRIWCRED